MVWIFSDPGQLYVEEGYNMLNLLLYKHNSPPEAKYYMFFQMMTFAILGLPPHYLSQLRQATQDPFSQQLAAVLHNVCS